MPEEVVLRLLMSLPLLILPLLLSWHIGEVSGASIETAPKRCPMHKGNLVDVDLFVSSDEECLRKCNKEPKCLFYFFYSAPIRTRQPPQCFMYESCERTVSPATEDCPIGKENVLALIPFIENEDDCVASCSTYDSCAYYKYFNGTDETQPMLCYHLKTCVPKLVKKSECPLEKNNYIDHRLFVREDSTCNKLCEDTPDCRFYYWYPIDYSPSPLYCYLFRSCIRGGDEPMSAVITGGRHPGQYFLSGGETVDFLVNDQVCQEKVEPEELSQETARGAAVSAMVSNSVLVCGGRNSNGTVMDTCLAYSPRNRTWVYHSNLLAPREEAACTVVRDTMFILGGIVDGEQTATCELWNEEDGEWQTAPDMPEMRARFCAVDVEGRFLAIIGGEMDGEVLDSMKTMDVETGEWKTQAQKLKVARKDHACVRTRLDEEDGILVTGGVNGDNEPLDSVEFFSIPKQEWISMEGLKVARTEHGLVVLNGIPTVVGGVAATEFLASVEQLDSSNNQNSPYQREWRVGSQALSVPRYDFAISSLPTRMVNEETCEKP